MEISTKQLQERLTELGFAPGPVDGDMGPNTEAAIVAFKRSVGLRARPFVGPITARALFAASARPSLRPWMDYAARIKGLHEGRDVNRLKAWFDKSVSWIDPREIPWCGAFVATCYRRWDPAIAVPENSLGARNWLKFGKECEPVFASCVVFSRGAKDGWKGHVGFYWGEDATYYHVLGGNQRNAVNVARIEKDRLLGARWPLRTPVTGTRKLLSPAGVPVTTNEA